MKDWRKEILTIPNLLSLFRLLLIPVYVVLYLNATTTADYILAAAVLGISCLTDMVDGKIARHFHMVSRVGIILDPLADKATQFTLLICLLVEYPEVLPLVILFVIKESFQLIAGVITLRKGRMMGGALMTGKISTTVLFLSFIAMMVLHRHMTTSVVLLISVIDSIFLLIAFIHYVIIYIKNDEMIQNI